MTAVFRGVKYIMGTVGGFLLTAPPLCASVAVRSRGAQDAGSARGHCQIGAKMEARQGPASAGSL